MPIDLITQVVEKAGSYCDSFSLAAGAAETKLSQKG